MNPSKPPKPRWPWGWFSNRHQTEEKPPTPPTTRRVPRKSKRLKFLHFLRDFAISYRAYDDLGGETYLPLVSDWDLSAAFLSASDPGEISVKLVRAFSEFWLIFRIFADLQLVIEPKTCSGNDFDPDDDEPWDVVRSTEVMNVIRDASQLPGPPSSASSGYGKSSISSSGGSGHQSAYHRQNSGSGSSKVLSAMSSLGGAVNQYPIALNSKINTAGIFNTVRKQASLTSLEMRITSFPVF